MPVLEFQCAKCFLVGNENDLKKKKSKTPKTALGFCFLKSEK